MSDTYPSRIVVEIDRVPLRRYLRTKWLLAWLGGMGALGVVGGMSNVGKRLKGTDQGSWDSFGIAAVSGIAIGVGIAMSLAILFYFLLSHRWAGRYAAELHLEVDGEYLRIRQHSGVLSDRKVHFRSIVDYATTQGPLMRLFGIQALQMTTPAGGQSSLLLVLGVKDCMKVRDMLSEIDRLRER